MAFPGWQSALPPDTSPSQSPIFTSQSPIFTSQSLPGYLKALERGNSVLRPKGFCEADKVKSLVFLSQNLECHNSCVIGNLLFYEKLLYFSTFWQIIKHSNEAWTLWERPGLPFRGLASLLEVQPPCKRPDLSAVDSGYEEEQSQGYNRTMWTMCYFTKFS